MASRQRIRQFFFPSLTTKFLVRIVSVSLFAYLLFKFILIPIRITGSSMDPTYRDGRINFCWTLQYVLSEPERFDVVAVRFAGDRVMLLKRVVALQGETIEFRDGKLFVDGREIDEPYVRYPYRWTLSPRRVKKNHVYVVGDNRNMPLANHVFGQTPIKRIVGVPLW